LNKCHPMTAARSAPLQNSIDSLAVPNVLVDHRLIAPGDELALLPEEVVAFANSVVTVRRASGAARLVARELMLRLGQPQRSIPKSEAGMPLWPGGIVGTLAHDSSVAIAAVAFHRDYSSLGIDIEPAERLDADLVDIVTTASERQYLEEQFGGRLLFAIKEAVYKAAYPLDRAFLNHHDVEVDLTARKAHICNGRIVDFRYCVASHIVALAFIPALNAPQPEPRAGQP
jgi:4'-phosphopantetheinyl transferase EntD